MRFKSDADVLQRFPYKLTDCVVVSYPKSGSTWVRFILTNLFYKPKPDFTDVQAYIPALSPEGMRRAHEDFFDFNKIRFMRSHCTYSSKFPKVLYVLRDGRDVLVSYYHHYRKFLKYRNGLSRFIKDFKKDEEWARHVSSWGISNCSNLVVLKYEDLLKDTFWAMKTALCSLHLGFNTERLKEAIQSSSFGELRRLEETKGLGYLGKPSREGIDAESQYFIRKGRQGGWKEVFTENVQRVIDERFWSVLHKLNYL
jgi:hypothetical protein